MSEAANQKKPSTWKSTALTWGSMLALFLFMRYTDQGTVLQGWLQQGLLSTGIMQADIRYAEDNNVDADFSLELTTLEGRPVTLESMKGKAIFMNFWATWCAPCLAEMPFIESLYKDLKDENVAFVIISTDDEAEVARKFIAAKEYTLPIYRLAGRVPEMYQVRTLPTTYVISPTGKMATVHVGMANYDTRGFRSFMKEIARADEQEL
jgi:thiol-disulfide isomerase/thioredoxin